VPFPEAGCLTDYASQNDKESCQLSLCVAACAASAGIQTS
jgi:hypothetical protein